MPSRKSIPPVTAGELEAVLRDEHLSVYLYLGELEGTAWANACLLQRVIPNIRVFHVTEPAEVMKIREVREAVEEFDPRGIVFGFGARPQRLLCMQETTCLRTVIEAVLDARELRDEAAVTAG